MINVVRPADHLLGQMLVGHVVNDALEPFVPLKVRYIGKPPRGEVVNDGDGFAVVD
jgi:hypothetical protein